MSSQADIAGRLAAQNAQNIFESVISLGTGGVENGLYHTK